MSIISVDMASLDMQCNRLGDCLSDIGTVRERVGELYREVCGMDLDLESEELAAALEILTESESGTEAAVCSLAHITELYAECENNILSRIDELPCGPAGFYARGMNCINGINRTNKTAGVKNSFFGHAIVNEDWLDALIF